MNDMTVGMENLPNVFIDKIFTLRPASGVDIIKIKIAMFDSFPDYSWKRQEMADLKIKMVFTNGEYSQLLKNGEISLYDFDPGLRTGVLIISASDLEAEEEMDGYIKFSKTIETNFFNVSDLDVYVSCFIDDIDFGIDIFDKYYGPLSGEKILVGGQRNNQSGYFYYPSSNEEYGGPVHGHNNSYMVGSEHSSDPHEKLRYVPEENYKIVDTLFDARTSESLGEPEELLFERVPDTQSNDSPFAGYEPVDVAIPRNIPSGTSGTSGVPDAGLLDLGGDNPGTEIDGYNPLG